ncbi:winged helix-turn-helix transcriptional regulator [Candidatus Woesearchaeota archaeon]|nr:winged helix-turn-helix transcriptional regulator [Candidatus Woesearchaeota archaeon]
MYNIRLLKALADSTRLQIVLLLLEREYTVSDLVSQVKKSQPNVSLALRKLENAELVSFRKVGKSVYYKIENRVKVQTIVRVIQNE